MSGHAPPGPTDGTPRNPKDEHAGRAFDTGPDSSPTTVSAGFADAATPFDTGAIPAALRGPASPMARGLQDPAFADLAAGLLEIGTDPVASPAARIDRMLDLACAIGGHCAAEAVEWTLVQDVKRHLRGVPSHDGSVVEIPLTLNGSRVGLLRLYGTGTTPSPAALAALVARSILREIAQKQRETTLRAAAEQDWLTGAATRRVFDRALRGILSAPPPPRPGPSLVLFDIDRFKAINDAFGHAMGDQVLRRVVTQTCRALSRRLPLYRIGGEEFALILPLTGVRAACVLAEALRRTIAQTHLPHGGSVTASFGVAPMRPRRDDADAWYARADAALYAAKAAGRDRVHRAP